MLINYETTTKLGSNIIINEYSDIIEVIFEGKTLSVNPKEFEQFTELVIKVNEDIKSNQSDFEI